MVDIAHHYGVERNPFQDMGVEGLFFPGAQREQMLEELLHHVRYNHGLLAVIGKPGSGKSIMLNALADHVSDDTDVVILQADPMMTLSQCEERILKSLDGPLGAMDVSTALAAFLELHQQCGRCVLVLIDDAHHLSTKVVRALYDRQQGYRDVLQCVFFMGDDVSWLDYLSAELEPQLWRLFPYNEQQTQDYLCYRLETTGWQDKNPFDERQCEDIYRKSGGLPGKINILATQFLQKQAERDSKRLAIGSFPVVILASVLGAGLIVGGLYWQEETDGNKNEFEKNAPQFSQGAVEREQSAAKESRSRKIVELELDVEGEGGQNSDAPKRPESSKIDTGRQTQLPAGDTEAIVTSDGAKDTIAIEKTALETTSEESKQPLLLPNKLVVQSKTETSKAETEKPELAQSQEKSAKTSVKEKNAVAAAKPVAESLTPADKSAAAIAKKNVKSKPKPAPSRYSADEEQLLKRPESHYVIQLIAIQDKKRLAQFLADLPASIKTRVYRRSIKGAIWYVAVTGDYRSADQARSALARFPDKLKKQKPWMKNVAIVQREIRSR